MVAYYNKKYNNGNNICTPINQFMKLHILAVFLIACNQMIICTSFCVLPTVRHVRSSLILVRRHTSNTLLYSMAVDDDYKNIKDAITESQVLIYPESYGKMPYPKSLSPSSALEFIRCPQSYLFQYLYNIKQPTNIALAKGSLCHSALEQLYDLKPLQRTLDKLENIFRRQWSKEKKTKYKELFMINSNVDDNEDSAYWDVEAEKVFGLHALELLGNYYRIEDPTKVSRPNPVHRERWVRAQLPTDPAQGITSSQSSSKPLPKSNKDKDKFLVRGIIDRVDLTRDSNDGSIVLEIVDYKTSKPPNFKYSAATNARILQEQFWQLKVYALLLREQFAHVEGYSVPFRLLRLMFIGGNAPRSLYLDLGSTQEERDLELNEIHVQLAGVWKDILELVEKQDPKGFRHCDRSFCWCHKVRGRFASGTVWENNTLS